MPEKPTRTNCQPWIPRIGVIYLLSITTCMTPFATHMLNTLLLTYFFERRRVFAFLLDLLDLRTRRVRFGFEPLRTRRALRTLQVRLWDLYLQNEFLMVFLPPLLPPPHIVQLDILPMIFEQHFPQGSSCAASSFNTASKFCPLLLRLRSLLLLRLRLVFVSSGGSSG